MDRFGAVDLTLLLVYLAGVTLWGSWLGRGQRTGRDYFLGGRDLPWGAVLLSVVATETSTLTFLSVPGVAYAGSLGFLQLAFGYILGRFAVAAWLLPAYYRGNLATAYALLEERFGRGTRRFASGIFMGTRLLADSVRLFATAIPLALITGWPVPLSIGAIGIATLAYTYAGGIRAVVWVDTAQMVLYVAGGLAAAAVLQAAVPGGWGEITARAGAAGKLAVLDLSPTLSRPYTLWAGLVGGAFLSMGSHGADQLMVQRLLTCRDLTSSRRALVGSGFAVLLQFALFLAVGLGLWTFYEGREFASTDEVFATFMVTELPVGLRGVLVAGVFAAAMSSLSSSINSLASAVTYDFLAPVLGRGGEGDGEGVEDGEAERRLLGVGRALSLLWAAALVGGAILFIPLSREAAAVEVALAVASLVYGGLLGGFFLALRKPGAPSGAVSAAIAAGVAAVTGVWLAGRATGTPLLAWPWFVPLGFGVTLATGWLLAGRPRE